MPYMVASYLAPVMLDGRLALAAGAAAPRVAAGKLSSTDVELPGLYSHHVVLPLGHILTGFQDPQGK